MKVFAYRSACAGQNKNLMLPKVVKHNGAHELFMNMYVVVVVGQRYYYIDEHVYEKGTLWCNNLEPRYKSLFVEVITINYPRAYFPP